MIILEFAGIIGCGLIFGTLTIWELSKDKELKDNPPPKNDDELTNFD